MEILGNDDLFLHPSTVENKQFEVQFDRDIVASNLYRYFSTVIYVNDQR